MSKPKKKKDERKYGSWWICQSCEGNPEFEHAEAMKHLREIHSIDTKTTTGSRSMRMHLDGDTWFSWIYDWDIKGVKLTQSTCNKRSPEDAAWWT